MYAIKINDLLRSFEILLGIKDVSRILREDICN